MTETAGMTEAAGVSRRSLLKGAAAVGGGLLLGVDVLLGPARAAAASTSTAPTAVTLYVKIGSDSVVTVLHPAAEMGQGTLSALAQLVAEELRLDWGVVRTEQVGNDGRYGNPQFGGRQITAGSRTMRGYYLPLRTAGAEARERLVLAAAQRWGVPTSDCVADRGVVTSGSGQRATYGELAAAAATVAYTGPPTLVPDAELRLLGRPVVRTDLRAKSDGSAVYGIDVRLPDMLYAGVQQAPRVGQTARGWRSPPTGFRAVAVSGGVAVVGGATTWHAMKAARELQVDWVDGAGTASVDSTLLREQAQRLLADSAAPAYTEELGVAPREAVAGAARRVAATYEVPFLAHHTLEPMNATAKVTVDASGTPTFVEVWAPTQSQASAERAAASAAGVPAGSVRVHVTLLGGGMGRRTSADYVGQAVTAAKAVPGRPVQLVWSREEDFTHDLYRPMATARLEAGLDTSGRITGLVMRLVAPSIRNTSPTPDTVPPPADALVLEGFQHLPYGVPRRLEWVRQAVHVPVGVWRAIGCSTNTFFLETFLDEVAQAAGRDPIALRRELLVGKPRHLAVLDAVRARSGWDKAPASGRARGVAFMEAFGSLVATVAEVSGSVSSPVVHRVTVAYDCGRTINPDTVAAQLQGAVVQGLSAAVSGGMPFKEGAPTKRNFDSYKIGRLSDTPPVVDVVAAAPTSTETPGGVGEAGLPGAAPALVNALARLTGTRARSLPLD